MVRAAFTAAQAASVSMILIAAKPNSVRFYQYMLGFEPIGLPAPYPPADFKVTLLGGSLNRLGVASDCGINSSKLPTKKSPT